MTDKPRPRRRPEIDWRLDATPQELAETQVPPAAARAMKYGMAMRKMSRYGLIAVFAALALSACSGNGDSNRPDPGVDVTPGAGTEPIAPPGETVREIAARSDTLLLADFPIQTERGEVRVEAECSGTVCQLRAPGLPLETASLADFSDDPEAWPEASETYRGVPLAEYTDRIVQSEFRAFGAWLEHTFFAAGAGDIKDVETGERILFPLAFSAGDATGTNPVSGSASWAGAMIGADTSATLATVRGHADLTVHFAGSTVDVAFSSITDNAGQARPNMEWSAIPMENGAFETRTVGNSIEGVFYGPAHDEVGGVFERARIVGAFGAKRQ